MVNCGISDSIIPNSLPMVDQGILITDDLEPPLPRPGSGTTVNDKIVCFLNSSSGAVRFLSTDFSNAFDKLSHSVIISDYRKFSLNDSRRRLAVEFFSRPQTACLGK